MTLTYPHQLIHEDRTHISDPVQHELWLLVLIVTREDQIKHAKDAFHDWSDPRPFAELALLC